MVGSRHLQGTIISRTKYLIESGSLKKAPVWFDVVQRFPPPSTSLLSLVAEEDKREIPKLTYPLDEVKREFYKNYFRAERDPTSLFKDIVTKESKTELFLKEYQKFVGEGKAHEEAFTKAIQFFEAHLSSLREKSDQRNYVNSNEQQSKAISNDLSTTDIYDMFSGKDNS